MNLHPIFQAALAPIIPPAPGIWQRSGLELDQADDLTDRDEDDDTCPACDGTGEGATEASNCGSCRGKGVVS